MSDGIQNYFLGCPVWSNRKWVGSLFSTDAKPQDFLRQYAGVFNSVEGNTTFYGTPNAETIARWRTGAGANFRFTFKFPRTISHTRIIGEDKDSLAGFFRTMEPLAEQIGLLFLQLPPFFDGRGLSTLESLLRRLPAGFRYAVEVRHADYFYNGPIEWQFNQLLESLAINRVMFDTGTLHAIEGGDDSILEAQRKKPKMRERLISTADLPFLRFVGHNEVEANRQRLTRLAREVAGWISEGKSPYVFIHAPDDVFAPALCRVFHQLLRSAEPGVNVGTMPAWPGEAERLSGEQLSLGF